MNLDFRITHQKKEKKSAAVQSTMLQPLLVLGAEGAARVHFEGEKLYVCGMDFIGAVCWVTQIAALGSVFQAISDSKLIERELLEFKLILFPGESEPTPCFSVEGVYLLYAYVDSFVATRVNSILWDLIEEPKTMRLFIKMGAHTRAAGGQPWHSEAIASLVAELNYSF